jgi:HEAT repeat protein
MRQILVLSVVVMAVGCGPRSTGDWLQQLKEQDVVLRREAIRGLGTKTAEAEQVVPALIEALHDENGYVRHDAATTLGKFGSEAQPAVPNLVVALKDKDRNVRTAAGGALKKIDPRTATKAGVR